MEGKTKTAAPPAKEKRFIIEGATAQAILDYLQEQKYRDVWTLIQRMTRLEPYEERKDAEDPPREVEKKDSKDPQREVDIGPPRERPTPKKRLQAAEEFIKK